MKKGIHPTPNPVEFQLSNGQSIYLDIYTLDGKGLREKDKIVKMAVDPTNHVAWTGAVGKVEETDKISQFRKKWGEKSMFDLLDSSDENKEGSE
ncbi:hypothetical protein GUI12_01305 [Anaplasmataceae bacterium AB001_6]|nr:hypothetical protein GUI12_01305 [Anaplasmataceae bacterium AB001_6]